MTDFRSLSIPAGRYPKPRRRIAAALATVAIAALTAAGCGTSSGSGSAGSQPADAQQAIQLAANETQKINSMALNLNVQMGSLTETGTEQIQVKPLLFQADLNMTTNGTSISMSMIGTSDAFYLKMPQLSSLTGKPWAKITVSQLSTKTGLNLTKAFQQIQNMGPANAGRLFTASKDIHKVGTATVDGVATTEYAGTYTAADAIKQLPPGLQKQMGSMLNSMGTSPISFQVWVDGNNIIRKMIENYTIAGQTAVITIDVTSVNQPVNIVLPPASDIGTMPGM